MIQVKATGIYGVLCVKQYCFLVKEQKNMDI